MLCIASSNVGLVVRVAGEGNCGDDVRTARAVLSAPIFHERVYLNAHLRWPAPVATLLVTG